MTADQELSFPGVRFGYKLPNCAGVICDPALARPEILEILAKTAESLRYDSLWLHDHLATPHELRALTRPDFYEPVVVLARLSAVTTRVRLGVATVILPLRDPVLLAKQFAALDGFTPGRFILGVGTGRYEDEFESLGSDLFPRRGRVTDEYLRIIRGLWTEDTLTHQGTFRQLTEARVYPKPRRPVPIWVGGNSAAAIRRAARLGDGWVPAALSPAEVREGVQALQAALAARGRDLRQLAVALSLTIELQTGAARAAGQLHAHRRRVAGDAGDVTEALRAYVDAGVTEFLLSFPAVSLEETTAHMARFAEAVIPRLR